MKNIFEFPKKIIYFKSMACIIISTVGTYYPYPYGVKTPDKMMMFFIPFGILKAEPMPGWFETSHRSPERFKFMTPGFAGNFLLLTYTLSGAFISWAFLR